MIKGKTHQRETPSASSCSWLGSIARGARARLQSFMAPTAGDTGQWGETVAAGHLRRHGYRILGRRIRTAQREEIDLIAATRDTLVFVEVKTRASEAFGRPFDAINRTKRRQMTRAAARYVQRLRRSPPYIRFDVVEVIGRPGAPPESVRHLENAFPPEAGFRFP